MEFGIELSTNATIIIGAIVIGYFILITAFGGYFSRFSNDINDFFYCGQRFSWWLAAASMVATGIGSYSYLKYSEQGFNTGMSSAIGYMNDWFALPFFMFGWLPIVYFSKVKSIPEYFERRFNKFARYLAVTIILAYMFYYIGYNLYTVGIALQGMFGITLIWSIPILAVVLGGYVTFGGQTAVIFTDFFQGIMLYVAGGVAIVSGIYALGGMDQFWGWLPVSHRLPFVHLTDDPKFNTAGLFWGEALAGSIAFAFMNQGFLMRYLTIKSVHEGRKAALFNLVITLPLSAVIVGAVGWIAKALVVKQAAMGGVLEGLNPIHIENTFHTFIVVCWETLQHNSWIFGFVVAALTAALMSTIDTLINACAAIGIYDIYKPLFKPEASDRHYLLAARWASVISTVIGVILVYWFATQKGSLMSIHYKGIMTIIPAIVTTIFLGAFWKKFTARAACVSMVVGSILTVITNWQPQWIDPLSAFVMGPENSKYIYMRSLFGMGVTALIGILVTLFDSQIPDMKKIKKLTIYGMTEAMTDYKGGAKPNPEIGGNVKELQVHFDDSIAEGKIVVNSENLKIMKANAGDMIYMSDSRWWLGGLRSERVIAAEADDKLSSGEVALSKKTHDDAFLLTGRPVSLHKIF